jgi:hypothetical protein
MNMYRHLIWYLYRLILIQIKLSKLKILKLYSSILRLTRDQMCPEDYLSLRKKK